MLWIDFKLYFYVRIHKYSWRIEGGATVVNWFQIVFLRENSQVFFYFPFVFLCCELISNCIFTWEFTRSHLISLEVLLLWIDFKLYFYVRIHKWRNGRLNEDTVVNWFQIVFLRENSQDFLELEGGFKSCELISNCIFTWEFTSSLPIK